MHAAARRAPCCARRACRCCASGSRLRGARRALAGSGLLHGARGRHALQHRVPQRARLPRSRALERIEIPRGSIPGSACSSIRPSKTAGASGPSRKPASAPEARGPPAQRRRRRRRGRAAPAVELAWRWPASGEIVARFGDRSSVGKGIDIAGRVGDDVKAAADGRVVYTGSGLIGYGKLVIIKHTTPSSARTDTTTSSSWSRASRCARASGSRRWA